MCDCDHYHSSSYFHFGHQICLSSISQQTVCLPAMTPCSNINVMGATKQIIAKSWHQNIPQPVTLPFGRKKALRLYRDVRCKKWLTNERLMVLQSVRKIQSDSISHMATTKWIKRVCLCMLTFSNYNVCTYIFTYILSFEVFHSHTYGTNHWQQTLYPL